MAQHRIVEEGLLLNPDGSLREPGWATSPLLVYNRNSVRASKYRMKEWDYYLVNDDDFAIAFTMCDAGYMGLLSVSVVDLRNPGEHTATQLKPMPRNTIKLPVSLLATGAEGVSFYEDGRVKMVFEHTGDTRVLDVMMRRFDGGDDAFAAHIELDEFPQDCMTIATPWADKKTAFYYNTKVVGMRARGEFSVGRRRHVFDGASSFGLLDWGRGVWTYDNRWFWGVAQGNQNGHVAALNIGYGFGDTTRASENMFFLDGVCHKLDRVDFGIPRCGDGEFDLMSRWHMTSNDGRFEMEFTPFLDRAAKINLGLLVSDQHQVFGKFDGTVVLDDGTRFEVAGLHGSAEVVHNRY